MCGCSIEFALQGIPPNLKEQAQSAPLTPVPFDDRTIEDVLSPYIIEPKTDVVLELAERKPKPATTS